MTHRCINLRDWESRRLLELAAGETAVLVRPVDARVPYAWEDRRGMPWPYDTTWSHGDDGEPWMPCPFGRPGDELIGREAWKLVNAPEDPCCQDWAYAVDGKLVEPRPLECRATRTGTLPASRTPARFARHRLPITIVEVRRCGLPLHDLLHAVDVPNDQRLAIRKGWPEKRHPWATSHAWVLRLGGEHGA